MMAKLGGSIQLEASSDFIYTVWAMNKAVEAMAHLEAMKAANTVREMQGETLAYHEESFEYLRQDTEKMCDKLFAMAESRELKEGE
jgi:hypothetical protein